MKKQKKNNNTLEYKGYIGSIEVSLEDNCLYGKLIGLQKSNSITYEGDNIEELKIDFERAVDDYLEHCINKNLQPEKPFSGSFNVRLNPELHKQAVLKAKSLGTSLNNYIREVVQKAVLG